ncbi:MAG: HDOD domain-containing protein [Gammaproteobacteria bacterium]
MAIANAVREYLERHRVAYRVLHHTRTTSLEQAAMAAFVPHNQVARGVLLKDEHGVLLAVLPLTHILDFGALHEQLGRALEPVPVAECARLFADCEAGSVPPLGEAYGFDVVVDDSLAESAQVYFEPGDRSILVGVRSDDFQLLCGAARRGRFAKSAARLSMPESLSGAKPAVTLRDFTPPAEMQRRLNQLYELPAIPDMAQRILTLRNDPNATGTELAAIVERDPSLAAQVMRYARAPLFAYQGKLDSINDAITRVLGYETVMNLALGVCAGKSLRTPPDGPLGLHAFWRHATYSAALTQALAALLPRALRPKAGLAYLAGLLHNFGYLLLGHLFQPEFYLLNKLVAANPNTPIVELEGRVLGMGQARDALTMGHAQMGAWLMQSWRMPEEVIVALREHHNPEYRGAFAIYPRLVLIADHLLKTQGIGDADPGPLPADMMADLGLAAVAVEAALERVLRSADELEGMSQLLAA